MLLLSLLGLFLRPPSAIGSAIGGAPSRLKRDIHTQAGVLNRLVLNRLGGSTLVFSDHGNSAVFLCFSRVLLGLRGQKILGVLGGFPWFLPEHQGMEDQGVVLQCLPTIRASPSTVGRAIGKADGPMGLDSEPFLKPIGRANSIRGQPEFASPSTVGRVIGKTDGPRFRAIPFTDLIGRANSTQGQPYTTS